MAWLGELHTVQRKHGMGDRKETEGVLFLEDDTDRFAPDFNNKGLGHGHCRLLNVVTSKLCGDVGCVSQAFVG